MKLIFGQPPLNLETKRINIFCHPLSLDSPDGKRGRRKLNGFKQKLIQVSDRTVCVTKSLTDRHSFDCPACGPVGLYRANPFGTPKDAASRRKIVVFFVRMKHRQQQITMLLATPETDMTFRISMNITLFSGDML